MKKCVLIYDDDLEILVLCKAILAQYQFRVETLSCCDDVLKDIEVIKPDIILMDLWIPEIGGEKAVIIIKENSATQHIPIILFSANTGIREIADKLKANSYIEKPFDIITLTQTIEKELLKAAVDYVS